jgi:hypothetical protein
MKNGMVMNRKCTDWWMCVIFFVFFLGMFATAGYGYKNGDPSKLITPFDIDGIYFIIKVVFRKLMWQWYIERLSILRMA